jgi:hypothetical protein
LPSTATPETNPRHSTRNVKNWPSLSTDACSPPKIPSRATVISSSRSKIRNNCNEYSRATSHQGTTACNTKYPSKNGIQQTFASPVVYAPTKFRGIGLNNMRLSMVSLTSYRISDTFAPNGHSKNNHNTSGNIHDFDQHHQ